MPKRAPQNDEIDPVRSRLAAAAAAPAAELPPPAPAPKAPSPAKSEEAPPRKRKQSAPARRPSRPQVFATPAAELRNRKFMVTELEAERMEEAIQAISRAFGGKVAQSQISRAMWTILADLEEGISRRPRGERRALPSTGNSDAQAEYERDVQAFLAEILRRGG